MQTGLDGIDYDWEFPTITERRAFSKLLERTREMLEDVGKKTNRTLELSVALPGPFTLNLGYSVAALNR